MSTPSRLNLTTTLPRARAALERTLCDLCTIQRRTVSGTDPYGETTYGAFADHLTDQVCRYWEVESPGEQPGTPRSTVTVESYLALPFGTDVTDDDQVTLVTDPSGADVVSSPRNIKAMRNTWVEIILTLEAVS